MNDEEFYNDRRFKEAVFRHRYHLDILNKKIDTEHCPICSSNGVVELSNDGLYIEEYLGESVPPVKVDEGEELN